MKICTAPKACRMRLGAFSHPSLRRAGRSLRRRGTTGPYAESFRSGTPRPEPSLRRCASARRRRRGDGLRRDWVNTVSFGLRVSVRAGADCSASRVQRRAPAVAGGMSRGFRSSARWCRSRGGRTLHTPTPSSRACLGRLHRAGGDGARLSLYPRPRHTGAAGVWPPVAIEVSAEPRESEVHDIHFNRGVASSQFYARRFGNLRPDELATPALRQLAMDWLSLGSR